MFRNQVVRLFTVRSSLMSARASSRSLVSPVLILQNQASNSASQPRAFSTSSISLAKKEKKAKGSKKGGKNQKAEEEETVFEELDPKAILRELETKFKSAHEKFDKELTVIKMGKANPQIFDSLNIKIDDGEPTNFTQLAQTTMKGKQLVVTVFEPNNVKKIVSAILAMQQNLTPLVDPKNEQVLKINLQSSSEDAKKEIAKKMRSAKDHYIHNKTNRFSLINGRADAINGLKNVGGSKDVITKLTADVHKLFKTYSEKIEESYKKSAILI